jgi:RNA polymerase sigma-70 factor, ECF subfamily
MSAAADTRVKSEISQSTTRTRLVRTARHILSEEEAEDAAHDAVVQALVSAHGFRADAQVGTWLYRIAFNAALMKQRSARRRQKRLSRLQHTDPAAAWLGEARLSAPGALEERETRERLRRAVHRLPDAYRAVIERCVYAEERAELVAADLGLTPSALRTRFARARTQLKALMAVADGAD